MPVERRDYTPQLSPTELEQFQTLRRSVFDTQIKPAIASKVSWLNFREPPIRGVKSPITPDQAGGVAPLLNKLGDKLSEIVHRAETDPTFGSYHLRLYTANSCQNFGPAAPEFHSFKRDLFDKAVSELFSIIQGDVLLKTTYSWDEISQIYKNMGKHMPSLPDGLIYVGGQDDGVINDTIWVTLPTKAPFMFVDYSFRLWGRWEGSSHEDDPVRPESAPRSVAIEVVTLDKYYPCSGQRSLHYGYRL